jgi:hypothetical protein
MVGERVDIDDVDEGSHIHRLMDAMPGKENFQM